MLTLTRFNSLARRNPTADDLMMRVTDDQSWINMHVISIPVCCWRPPFRQSDRARRADAGNGYSFRQYISFGPSSSASELEAIRPPLSLSGHGRRAGRREDGMGTNVAGSFSHEQGHCSPKKERNPSRFLFFVFAAPSKFLFQKGPRSCAVTKVLILPKK
jgi:hypothetical protein